LTLVPEVRPSFLLGRYAERLLLPITLQRRGSIDYAGDNTTQMTPIETTPDMELHQFVPYVEQAVVGFQWQW
jgi:hypothetical protein